LSYKENFSLSNRSQCPIYQAKHYNSMDINIFDLNCPETIDEAGLIRALGILTSEQSRRALANYEPEALIENAFATGFTSKFMPKDPIVVGGILICMGAKLDRSVTNHRCAFVKVAGNWSWEHPDQANDVVRYLPGPHGRMQTVTLIPAIEGMAVDLVEAKTKNGVHEFVGVRSFVFEQNELLLVAARAVSRTQHR
jgi:hypothetical protein